MRKQLWIVCFAVGCTPSAVQLDDTGDVGPVGPPLVEIPDEGPAVVESFATGHFAVLPSYLGAIDNVYGQALLVRYLDGTSEVSVQVSGLSPSTEHSVHVHTQPCSYDAGPHYKIDPTVVDTVESNEVWPSFTTDVDGNGRYGLTVPHAVRGDALAVVVHDPIDNAKLACADLARVVTVGERSSGAFGPFADADPVVDAGLGGTVDMTVGSSSTTVTVSLTGLDEAGVYTSHVHALPCDTDYGGGHYKFDPTEEDTVEANEVWPMITVEAGGSSSAEVSVPYALRADAQAVVLHKNGPKVGCADLVRASYVGQAGSGSPYAVAGSGADGITGTGSISRRLDGITVVEVSLDGLSPDAEYPIHLHAQACGAGDGGGHYLIDPTVADTLEENEIWATVVSDGSGSATATNYATHVARAEAQSMVIHDGVDNARLACIDLD